MASEQRRSIAKTVVTLVAIMLLILGLFLNKITTPRYLSLVELKINGLVWLDTPISIDGNWPRGDGDWLLVANNDQQEHVLNLFAEELRESIKNQSQVITITPSIQQTLLKHSHYSLDNIILINPNQQVVGYFNPPFDFEKMVLTYSSVITHR